VNVLYQQVVAHPNRTLSEPLLEIQIHLVERSITCDDGRLSRLESFQIILRHGQESIGGID
jgi:hypothetical protein